ncbi:hypothetical protein F5H01DRAFT_385139, partial [Linnemannia elongata]
MAATKAPNTNGSTYHSNPNTGYSKLKSVLSFHVYLPVYIFVSVPFLASQPFFSCTYFRSLLKASVLSCFFSSCTYFVVLSVSLS